MPAKKGRPALTPDEKKRRKVEKLIGRPLTDGEWALLTAVPKSVNDQSQIGEMMQKIAHAQSQAQSNILPTESDAPKGSHGEPGEDDPDYEQKKIAEINAAMAGARSSLMQSIHPHQEIVTDEGDHERVFIGRSRELSIEDEPGSPKPQFVQQDEEGWVDEG
jgi:hypothetical protein